MFDKKQTVLTTPRKSASSNVATVSPAKNAFVQHGLKSAARTVSGNGSEKFLTTGMPFVDEFGTAGRFRSPRDFKDVDASMRKLWAENRVDCVKFAFYLRMVTRQVVFPDGTKTEETQRGQGLKHESIYRVMWLAINHPKVFWNNVHLYISVGGWKDIITMLSYDLQYNGWKARMLDWDKMGKLIMAGLENPKTTNLIKKYLPQVKANSYCRTLEAQADNMIAKWICSLIFGGKPEQNNASTYKMYRKLKSSGTAHQWQQAISQGNILNINFDTVHGRALALLVSGKFLKNNKLEDRYAKWIAAKPVAKFTGYVHELAEMVKPGIKQYQIDTINAQFNQLVAVAMARLSAEGIRPISAVDTRGSMDSLMYIGNGQVGKLKSIQIAFSSTLFFDEMVLPGTPFKNSYLCFSGRTSLHQFSGTGFVERYTNIMGRRGSGGTNFESVFQFFADFKRNNPNVPESEIPNFVVCWSD